MEVNATTYTPDEPLVNDMYYWRVRAIDEGVPGLWSEVWSFTVDAGNGHA